MSFLKRALREPLLHFFALGALVFLLYAWISGGTDDPDTIVVSRGQQRSLIEVFAQTWGRPPTQEEFRSLIDDYLREELAYREASARELDRNDTIVRRRLRQKLEFLAEDLVTLAPLEASEMEAWYAANAERYRTETRYSFEQIDFSTDRRGPAAESDALALLATLRAGGPLPDEDFSGDSRVLPQQLSRAGEREIDSTFGEGFSDDLARIATGQWDGPLSSAFGWHLVRVDEKIPGAIPPLTAIEDRVQSELLVERRRAALDLLYASLAERYSIRIEPLDEPDVAAGAAE